MNEEVYLALAHIAGEVWGTLARAHMNKPVVSTQPGTQRESYILGYDVYFEILGRLKADFNKEVTTDETETTDG